MTKIKSLFVSIISLGILYLASATNVLALETPSFPLCSNPQGDLVVFYDSGVHGIVGDSNTYTGKDWVYNIGDGNFMQCLCQDNGNGIQTNWWFVNGLSREQVENFIDAGWIYVADGSSWGLTDNAYLARNSNYSCGGVVTPTPTPTPGFQFGGPPVCTADRPNAPQLLSVVRSGSTATLTWTKVDKATHYTISYGTDPNNLQYGVFNTGNVTSFVIRDLDPNTKYFFTVYAVNDCMPSLPSTTPTGGVLGMAATGNLAEIYSLLSFGVSSVMLGLVLKKRAK